MADEARAEAVFNEARRLDSPEKRAAFLTASCAGDEPLRARVLALLSAHELTGDLLAEPGAVDARAVGTAEFAKPSERIGATIAGKYKLLQKIGQGGMGVVYMARQTEPIRRDVALKIILPGMDSQQVLARFEAERQALAMLDHPNVARVFDAGKTERGQPFFVMELIKGVPITQFCDEQRLSVPQRLELFVAVCHAIQHAHQKGIIHRDVKPSNVLVAMYDDHPSPKIIDFGVAKATTQSLTERTLFTQYGAIVGTVEYMSPEQAKFNALDIDTRTDVYALGVLLYELLTGTTPFERSRLRSAAFDEMLRIIREEEPPTPSRRLSSTHELPAIAAQRGLAPRRLGPLVRGDLDWIVMKCLEKDRGRRYESASSLAADLSRYLAEEPVLAGPPGALYRIRKFVRRRRGTVMVAAAAVIGIALSIAGQAWQLRRETAARKAAQQSEKEALDAKALEAEARRDAVLAKDRAIDAQKKLDAQKTIAESERTKADAARTRAEEERDAKNLAFLRSDGLRLAAESNAMRTSDPGLAVLLGIEAVARYRHPLTFASLFEAKAGCRELAVLEAEAVGADHMRFLSNGKRLATGGKNPRIGSAAVWDLENGKAVSMWHGFQLNVTDLTVRPDERRIACAVSGSATLHYDDKETPKSATFTDRVAYVWDAATGRDVLHLRGHEDTVVSVSYSPDGRKLLTGSHDQTARLWDGESGRTLHVFAEHENSLRRAFFSPDGRRAVTLTQAAWFTQHRRKPGKKPHSVPADVDPGVIDRPVKSRSTSSGGLFVSRKLEKAFARLWDVETGKEVGALLGESPIFFKQDQSGDTRVAAYSHDGKWIAVSFSTGRIGLWPASGGEAKAFLTGHTGSVDSLAFSPDDKRLASAGEDLTVRIWDVEKKKEISKVKGDSKPIHQVSFAPNGKTILVVEGNAVVRLIRDNESVALRGHRGEILSAAFSPDGKTVVSGDQFDLRLWSVDSPRPIAKEVAVHGAAITAFAVSRDDRLLATGSLDATVQVWDLKENRQRWISAPCLGPINGISFAPGGATVFAATGLRREAGANPLSAAPNSKLFLDEAQESTAPYWNAFSGKLEGAAATGSNGSRAVVASTTGRLIVVGDGETHSVKKDFWSFKATITKSLSGAGHRQQLFDLAVGSAPIPLPQTVHDTDAPVFKSDGRSFLSVAENGRIRQTSSLTGKKELEFIADDNATLEALFLSPGDEYLLGAWRQMQKMSIWRTSETKPLGDFTIDGPINVLLFHPDRKRFLICSGRTPRLRRLPDGQTSIHYVGHEMNVVAAALSHDGKLLVTGGDDRTAALWETDTGKLLAVYRGHPGAVRHVAFAGEDQVITASTDGMLRFWPRDVLDSIRRDVRRKFTPAERRRYDLPQKPPS